MSKKSIEDIFNQSGYTIPTDKHDECTKRFDYWDMVTFPELVIEKHNESIDIAEKEVMQELGEAYGEADSTGELYLSAEKIIKGYFKKKKV